MKPVTRIRVVPDLPKPLSVLNELAYNLRWSWDQDSWSLFKRLDPDLWEATGHNPVSMLGRIHQSRLKTVVNDGAFMSQLERVTESFRAYMESQDTWYNQNYGDAEDDLTIAYFSMEFGITESLKNYSGGLGILSGDHLKSASDLGIPLIGVGLLYQEGYFQQYLNNDGFQQESYPLNDYANLPVSLARNEDGTPIKISVPMVNRNLYAIIWKVQVGRIPLYLLDSNVEENYLPEDLQLTNRLYGGDQRTRIRQEMLLGIGGIRALDELGLRPDVCHMNEGHSAFLALERIRQLMAEKDLSFAQAKELAAAHNVFTTHTPVPAGLERFGFDLIDEHFTPYFNNIGLTRDEFLDLGREDMGDYELFSMPVLALRLSSAANGVAQLHGRVSRGLWTWLFPDLPQEEIPIDAITNGVHLQTWISDEMADLFDNYLHPSWREEEDDFEVWQQVDRIPDGEIWRARNRNRYRLVSFVRERYRKQLTARNAPTYEIAEANEILDPEALTIGFARRFATYKRATLLFQDIQRIKNILTDSDRPMQIIFAGKAHPADIPGKELIQSIVNITLQEGLQHSVVFLENYDMDVARHLVQGVDVWLNTPRRPKEASGTSGMKVTFNAGLNCSILDGWWAEAYQAGQGWAIGKGEEYPEELWPHQDFVESQNLYQILEKELIPAFYDRGRDQLPAEWLRMVKESIKHHSPYFSTRRMVKEYHNKFYIPSHHRARELTGKNITNGLTYVAWRHRIEELWRKVAINRVLLQEEQVHVGEEVSVFAEVQLGSLSPLDVSVQLYFGKVSPEGLIDNGSSVVPMEPISTNKNGVFMYKSDLSYPTSGEHGVSVRVLPHHAHLPTPYQPNLITWAKS
ncbi:MAG: alpha-glucan family phosphorylase [Chloroflexi bacterium]|nr:alpha-glucan family phosphorylase [Chloroflexota bacterium]